MRPRAISEFVRLTIEGAKALETSLAKVKELTNGDDERVERFRQECFTELQTSTDDIGTIAYRRLAIMREPDHPQSVLGCSCERCLAAFRKRHNKQLGNISKEGDS